MNKVESKEGGRRAENTWQDLEGAIGKDFSGGETRTGADEVERGAIRKYCEPIELDCPLHHDDDVAKKYGYDGIIAPYSAVHQTFSVEANWKPGDETRWPTNDPDQLFASDPNQGRRGIPLPHPPTSSGFVTDMEIEYVKPVYVGDRLTTSGRKLLSVQVKKTSVGFGAFMTFESEIHDQNGDLVARVRNGSYAFNPGADS